MNEVESFFTDHSDSGSAGLAVQQAKEIVRGITLLGWTTMSLSLRNGSMNICQLFDNIIILYFTFLAVPDLKSN